MLKFKVRITREVVSVTPQGQALVLSRSRRALEAQALSGKNREGQPILGKGGKRLDLHDSGKLWQNVTEAPAEGGLIFNEPYAQFVLTKHKADALSPENQKILEETLTTPLQPFVINKEVK